MTFTESTADFSPCRGFRYRLTRRWSAGPTLVVLGLNPSTADERKLDPTITRCVNRAERLGFGRLVMLNLFGWHSTDPKALRTRLKASLPIIGEDNDATLRREAAEADMVIAAWGVHGLLAGRAQVVQEHVLAGVRLHCLGTTKLGHPRHPLYLPYSAEPRVYGGRRQ